MTTSIKSG